jgi:outer membrane protein TolC
MPTVALFGKRELYTEDLTLFEPTWAVGANLQWNLFAGGQTAGKQQSAKALQREVSQRTAKAKKDVDLLVEKRWRELEHANGRLLSLAKTTELADESLRAQQKAFAAGMATSLDVVDAQLALARVRVARLKAEYDADVALAGLLEATVMLTIFRICWRRSHEEVHYCFGCRGAGAGSRAVRFATLGEPSAAIVCARPGGSAPRDGVRQDSWPSF